MRDVEACLRVEQEFQQKITWRISPRPFQIDRNTYAEIESLGALLLEFYRCIQELYFGSASGRLPRWIGEYLELGKPEQVIEYGRMRRFRRDVPLIIRPDILLTEDGLAITELDSVPGGFGLTAELGRAYTLLGYDVIGGPDGIVQGFAQGIRGMVEEEPVAAIVVSEESSDYREEMEWLAKALREQGLMCFAVAPQELVFQEDGLYIRAAGEIMRITVLYRFFELFDLKNIPKIDLIMYAVRKRLVRVTPPLKSYLEEKLNFALFHHPSLAEWWEERLGEGFAKLRAVIPQTWVVDNRPLPPHAVIPGLEVNGRPVTDFSQVAQATQSGREFVLKVSGFSALAWGSRGVAVGQDLSQADWNRRVAEALESFPTNPYILQEFRKARQVETAYYDSGNGTVREMRGRVRLCPYFFVHGPGVSLGGILATICPADKKLIHGMVDAVMVPTMVDGS
ncbi:MAG: hypothetical protein AA931_00035 [Peptococcaceae bacterium 1109]|nr:MAG: hypothetical protein AA931_00035 [Peptococcaceae bacterium 1109]